MKTYFVVDPTSNFYTSLVGWDEVWKWIRDKGHIQWLIYKMAPDFSSGKQVDVKFIRDALLTDNFVIGSGEPE